ncbi:c6 finger domain [Moniliophthora roreri]|nr:c6 finger domain [Moniliophthora roreri]
MLLYWALDGDIPPPNETPQDSSPVTPISTHHSSAMDSISTKPRKRALMACSFCRKRKIKASKQSSLLLATEFDCNSHQCNTPETIPRGPCQRCKEKNLQCEYIPVGEGNSFPDPSSFLVKEEDSWQSYSAFHSGNPQNGQISELVIPNVSNTGASLSESNAEFFTIPYGSTLAHNLSPPNNYLYHHFPPNTHLDWTGSAVHGHAPFPATPHRAPHVYPQYDS